tara:strand:+ start:1255 stop:1509 length:255 start_codon:yes stop_codon:yes gene_type:complete
MGNKIGITSIKSLKHEIYLAYSKREEEKTIKRCNKKGYRVYRINHRLFIVGNALKTDILFEYDTEKEITNAMIKYLKEILRNRK